MPSLYTLATAESRLSLASDASPALESFGKAEKIVGTEGADSLSNDGSPAKFLGLGGDDAILGGEGADTALGGDGNDILLGYGGNDRLVGGRGNDVAFGYEGDDKLVGGGGDDLLRGYAGNDTLSGGAGYDIGSIMAYGSATPLHWDLSGFKAGHAYTHDDGLGGTDTFIGIERLSVTATAGDDVLTGSDADSGFTTGGGSDWIDAAGGDDFIAAYGASPTLIGGSGDDQISIFAYNYSGTPHFLGGHQVVDGGKGFDRIVIDWSYSSSDVALTWGHGSAHANLADGSSSIAMTGIEAMTFHAGSGGTSIQAGDGDDIIYGGYGSKQDVIDAGGGNDLIQGGSAADILTGGDGDDRIYGRLGNDTLSGGQGIDLYGVDHGLQEDDHGGFLFDMSGFDVSGGSHTVSDFNGGIDVLSGFEAVEVYTNPYNFGSDTVIGSAGRDIIHDSAGSDLLQGGAGDDLILQTPDLIDDFYVWDRSDTLQGGKGTDTLSFALAYVSGGAGWIFDLEAGTVVGEMTLTDRISGFEHVIGSAADDTIQGSATGETLEGGAGYDLIEGRGGADVLTGGDRDDVFVYRALSDSSADSTDLLTDVQAGDTIDLSLIDANSTVPGDQAFHKVASFTNHAGELVLKYDLVANVTHLTADVDGDGHADFAINLSGDQHQFAGFVL